MQVHRLLLILIAAKLLSHLLHQVLNHVNIGYLSIIEVVLDLINILLGQTLVWLVDWSQFLIFAGMVEHALLVAINAEAIQILDAGNVFLKVVQLSHLLKLLKGKLLDEDRLHNWDFFLLWGDKQWSRDLLLLNKQI